MTLLPNLTAMLSTPQPETAFARKGEELDVANPSDPTFVSFLDTLSDGDNAENALDLAIEDIDDNKSTTTAEDEIADAEEDSKKQIPAVDFLQERPLTPEEGGKNVQVSRMSMLLPTGVSAIELEVKTPPQHQSLLESGGSNNAKTLIGPAGRIAKDPVLSTEVPQVAEQNFSQPESRLSKLHAYLAAPELNQVEPTLKANDQNARVSALLNGQDPIVVDPIRPRSEKPLDIAANEHRMDAQLTASSRPPSTLAANIEYKTRESALTFTQAPSLLNAVPFPRPQVSTTPAIDMMPATNENVAAISDVEPSLPRVSEKFEAPKTLPIERKTTSLHSQIGVSASAPLAARDHRGYDGPSLKDQLQEIGALTPLKSEQAHFTPQASLQSLAPKVLPAGNAQAITDAVLTLRDTGGKIDVTLSPEELGRLTIKLDQTAHGNHFTLSAERGDVQDLIRRQIEQLQNEFRSMGFENATFAFENQNKGQDDTENMRSNQGNTQTATSDAIIEQHQFAPSSGVDIRI